MTDAYRAKFDWSVKREGYDAVMKILNRAHHPDYHEADCGLCAIINALLDWREAARAGAVEECAKAVCDECAEGSEGRGEEPILMMDGPYAGNYFHPHLLAYYERTDERIFCKAQSIRALLKPSPQSLPEKCEHVWCFVKNAEDQECCKCGVLKP